MEGRRALVTGGASGIGARRRSCWPSGRAGGDGRPKGGDIDADLRQPDAVERAVEEAAERLGGPADLLVAAAGVYRITPALELDVGPGTTCTRSTCAACSSPAGRWRARLIEAGLPGTIVNLASTAALEGDAAEPSAHYNASKAGVVALTRQLAIELAPHGSASTACARA